MTTNTHMTTNTTTTTTTITSKATLSELATRIDELLAHDNTAAVRNLLDTVTYSGKSATTKAAFDELVTATRAKLDESDIIDLSSLITSKVAQKGQKAAKVDVLAGMSDECIKAAKDARQVLQTALDGVVKYDAVDRKVRQRLHISTPRIPWAVILGILFEARPHYTTRELCELLELDAMTKAHNHIVEPLYHKQPCNAGFAYSKRDVYAGMRAAIQGLSDAKNGTVYHYDASKSEWSLITARGVTDGRTARTKTAFARIKADIDNA